MGKAKSLLKMLDHDLRESLPILSAEADLALAQRQFKRAEKFLQNYVNENQLHHSTG